MNHEEVLSENTVTLSVKEGAWHFEGAITLYNAGSAFLLCEKTPLPASGVIYFSGVTRADSAALSLALSLIRRARKTSAVLDFRGVPEALKTLARVYGVETLFHRVVA